MVSGCSGRKRGAVVYACESRAAGKFQNDKKGGARILGDALLRQRSSIYIYTLPYI